MKPPIDDTRRHLGELAGLSRQTEDMERTILTRAEDRLARLQSSVPQLRVSASTGRADAASIYTDTMTEIGQLHQVIARAQQALGIPA